MDLKKYRLNDISEFEPFKQQMGEKQFFDYAIRVYKRLAAITPHKPLSIQREVVGENYELFVKIACLYIVEFQYSVVFNETFTIIKTL